jgi:hypothetical protein
VNKDNNLFSIAPTKYISVRRAYNTMDTTNICKYSHKQTEKTKQSLSQTPTPKNRRTDKPKDGHKDAGDENTPSEEVAEG